MVLEAPEPCRSLVSVLVMAAPVAGALIFALGLPKLGWFNVFCACTSICHRNLSVVWKFFISARSMFRMGGPSRILRPALPNRQIFVTDIAFSEFCQQMPVSRLCGLAGQFVERDALANDAAYRSCRPSGAL